MNTELKSHLSKNIEFKAFLEKKTPFYSEIIRFITVNDVLHTHQQPNLTNTIANFWRKKKV